MDPAGNRKHPKRTARVRRADTSPALPLLLRLTLLRRQRGGAGSLAEQGYALAVALIASFVLLLGVGALASRGQLGFIGQVFQVQNRQARDVADAAVAQFSAALNREQNRYLLVAGDATAWGTSASTVNRNVCTAFEDDQTLSPGDDVDNPSTFDPVDSEVFTRFSQGNDFQPLVRAADDEQPNLNRRFRVERIEYLNANRQSYSPTITDGDGNITQSGTRDLMLSGATTALIRVTMIGQVEQNGRTSQARVAREFEVVPKCCKRSFAFLGAQKWGRDPLASCQLETGDPGKPQFFVSLDGGEVTGSKNVPDIKDQDNKDVAQAACWSGFPDVGSDPNTSLNTDVNPETDLADCLAGDLFLGKGDGDSDSDEYLGVSFAPTKFDVILPDYARNNPDVVAEPWLATGLIDGTATPAATSNEDQWFDYDISHEDLTRAPRIIAISESTLRSHKLILCTCRSARLLASMPSRRDDCPATK